MKGPATGWTPLIRSSSAWRRTSDPGATQRSDKRSALSITTLRRPSPFGATTMPVALVHARAAHQIAHERGDTNAELIALRCLSCVQAEALSPEVAPAAEGLYQMVRNIDAQTAALNDQRVSIETRIHHLLVAVRIRLYAGLFDEHYRNTLDSAIQLLSDLDSAPNADPSQLRRIRALVDAYEAAWDVWVRKIPPDTSRLARIGAWIREDGRADYCLIRWPLDRRSL